MFRVHHRVSPLLILDVTENFVSLRYTATGSHVGEPHAGIPASGKKAQWTAAGNFVLDEHNLIQCWWKDWDKMQSAFRNIDCSLGADRCLDPVWKQLGWVMPLTEEVEFA